MTNSIQETLTITQNKARMDSSCKRILSEKMVLAWILKECTKEFQDIAIPIIAERCIEPPDISSIPVAPDRSHERIEGLNTEDRLLYEGTVLYDIRFRAVTPDKEKQIGLIINIEVQNNLNLTYPILKRAMYYGARLLSAQHGMVFSHSQYEKIQKVYSIWILPKPKEGEDNSLIRYSMAEHVVYGNTHHSMDEYDMLSIILIGLATEEQISNDIIGFLTLFFSEKINLTDKKKRLKDGFDLDMTPHMEQEVTAMCNYGDAIEQDVRERVTKEVTKEVTEKVTKKITEEMTQKHQEQTIQFIKALIPQFGSAEAAMDKMKMTAAEKKIYLALL